VSEPQILDSAGNRLQVGDRVRMVAHPPAPPDSPLDDGRVVLLARGLAGWGVEVEWPDMDSTCIDWYPTQAKGATELTCGDLTLIPTQEDD
jgi:hypothetical protein